jgi:hypothetical protein
LRAGMLKGDSFKKKIRNRIKIYEMNESILTLKLPAVKELQFSNDLFNLVTSRQATQSFTRQGSD